MSIQQHGGNGNGNGGGRGGGVHPPQINKEIRPGDSIEVTKTVRSSSVPANPDIVFLADTTVSMRQAVDTVKEEITDVMRRVLEVQPNAHFGVAQYKDTDPDRSPDQGGHPRDGAFSLDQPVTDDTRLVDDAIKRWRLTSGHTREEAQLPALRKVADPATTRWRSSATNRILVWFGDYPGRVERGSLRQAIDDAADALKDENIRVVAISTGADQLNEGGRWLRQADEIISRTRGRLLHRPDARQISDAILDGINELPVTLSPQATCDEGLSVRFDPPEQSVVGGEEATFTETITVAPDAPQGQTLSCTVRFLGEDGKDHGPAFTQTLNIRVKERKKITGLGRLRVFVSKLDDPCKVDDRTWFVTLLGCDGKVFEWCGKRYLACPAECGHVEFELPPGTYTVIATWNYYQMGKEIWGNHFTDHGIAHVCCEQSTCLTLYTPSAHRCGALFKGALNVIAEQPEGLPEEVREELRRAQKAVGRAMEHLPQPGQAGELDYLPELTKMRRQD